MCVCVGENRKSREWNANIRTRTKEDKDNNLQDETMGLIERDQRGREGGQSIDQQEGEREGAGGHTKVLGLFV